jgi:predicted aspartyl protease
MPAYDGSQFDPPAPVARVTIRHPISRQSAEAVTMLLDTGADVSLLPRTSVEQIGVLIESQNGYEVMGFDGSVSVAPSAEVELVFLGRVFKGRFLLIDQECGIIGRDVMNRLSIVFDGVHLEWKES